MADSGDSSVADDDPVDDDERPDHLDDLEDGVGCTGVWERLSADREE
ncbi:hypothetical protein ACOZ4N_13515 [Halorientalis pallida]